MQDGVILVLGFILAFAFSAAIWFGIIVFIGWIVSLFRVPVHFTSLARKALFVSVVIGLLVSVPNAVRSWPKELSSNPQSRLTEAEKARYQEIIAKVMQERDYLTPSTRSEFWSLQDKVGPMSVSQLAAIKTLVVETSVTYQRAFYQDAAISQQTGKPTKSPARETLERELRAKGAVTDARIKDNDTMITKIAAHEPISVRGTDVVFTQELIGNALSNIDDVGRRLDSLYTRP